MSLRKVDKLVREEKYELALKLLLEVREAQPNNPYLPAYEERLRSAIEIRGRGPEGGIHDSPAHETINADFPPVEEQLKAIARPMAAAAKSKEARALEQKKREEQRRVALLSKIASLIASANGFLEQGDFARALEEVGRANMLEPGNTDIADLEQRIRSSQEEAERVAEEQRLRALRREEEEREQRMRLEREQALREADERRHQHELARRAAQEQKVALCLQRSREFLESGLLDEAQAELAFALVLQPDNREAGELEGQLTRRYEQRRQAELARQREEEEERRREEERLRVAIATAVREAEDAARAGDFAGALARITRAYIDDPGNASLMAAEASILAARDEWARRKKEEALAAEDSRRRAREEEERKRQEAERRRVLQEREAQARAKQKEEEEQLWYHLRRARTLLAAGNHDQALAEVALAFVVNPFSEEVKHVEAEILTAQRSTAVAEDRPTGGRDSDAPSEETVTQDVQAMLERALIHGTRREFARAFEEIASAYALAPLHPSIAECERKIRRGFVEYQESLALPPHETARTADPPPARSGGRKAPRRNKPKPASAPAAPLRPSVKPASLKTGRSSRSGRMVMTILALGAISLTAAYLVNTNRPGPRVQELTAPAEAAAKAAQRTTERPAAPQQPMLAVTAPMPQDHRPAAAALQEAGFSPIPEYREPPAEASKIDDAGESVTLADSVPSSRESGTVTSADTPDEAGEAAGDLYASPGLPATETTRAPQILRLTRPQLTDVTRRSEAQEEITVMVEIGADGTPLQARVVKSTYPPYNHAVIDAVMRSEFQAAVTPAGPAAKWMTIPFRIKP